jgi:hypothetical protein
MKPIRRELLSGLFVLLLASRIPLRTTSDL